MSPRSAVLRETGLNPTYLPLVFAEKKQTIILEELFPDRMRVEIARKYCPGFSSGSRHSSPVMRMLHGTSHNWHLPRNCPLLKNISSSRNMPPFHR